MFDTGPPLTVVRFDALLVDQLGLGEVAEHVQQAAAAAGLTPPSYFGSEVVARYLGLRYDHPARRTEARALPMEHDHARRSRPLVRGVLGLAGGSGERPRRTGEGRRAKRLPRR